MRILLMFLGCLFVDNNSFIICGFKVFRKKRINIIEKISHLYKLIWVFII